jgi:hypothetical protein
LLEVVIACVIGAIAFAVIFHSTLASLISVRTAGAEQAALMLARSHLALAGRELGEIASEGDDGPFHWRVQVTREAVAEPGPGVVNWFLHKGEARPTLYDVNVAVSWEVVGRRESVQLDTKRLGFIAPPPTEQ